MRVRTSIKAVNHEPYDLWYITLQINFNNFHPIIYIIHMWLYNDHLMKNKIQFLCLTLTWNESCKKICNEILSSKIWQKKTQHKTKYILKTLVKEKIFRQV